MEGVFIVSPDLLVRFPALILRLALDKGLPLPSQRKEWVAQGALFSYGPNYAAVGRDARYVDMILKGTHPPDLPVEQMSRFELIINLKTAQALGFTIPPMLLFQADEVIRGPATTQEIMPRWALP